jgi:hypothetical protein
LYKISVDLRIILGDIGHLNRPIQETAKEGTGKVCPKWSPLCNCNGQ